MEKINYDGIKTDIMNYQNHYILITKQVLDSEIQKDILLKYLSENKVENMCIEGYLSVMELNDLKLLDYKTGINEEEVNNLIIVNSNKENPIFEVTSKKNVTNGNGIIVEETRIYNQSKRIVFSKKEINKFIDNQVINRQVILVKKMNSSCEYEMKHYEFMYNGEKCVIIGIDNNYKMLGDNSFTNRLELAYSHIQKFDTVFESYLNSNFGIEETKTYQIKRKVKK